MNYMQSLFLSWTCQRVKSGGCQTFMFETGIMEIYLHRCNTCRVNYLTH